jgi:High-affinity nickel permease
LCGGVWWKSPERFRRDGWRTRADAADSGIALLHLAGIGLWLDALPQHPALTGLGLAAYLLGLKHAFDVDHIVAVDDTIRYLVQRDRPARGVGFYFALGHSTIVFLLSLAIGLAAARIDHALPALREIGGIVGGAVSGLFLIGVGLLNLRVAREQRAARRADGAAPVAVGGVLSGLLRGRLRRLISRAGRMYWVGLLFGLGFDTASEVALLALTAGAAGALPTPGVLALPLLFAGAMTLVDTIDGVLMAQACRWADVDPRRRVRYNRVLTSLAVAAAFLVGGLELTTLAASRLHITFWPLDRLAALDGQALGYVLAALLALLWLAFWVWSRRARTESAA